MPRRHAARRHRRRAACPVRAFRGGAFLWERICRECVGRMAAPSGHRHVLRGPSAIDVPPGQKPPQGRPGRVVCRSGAHADTRLRVDSTVWFPRRCGGVNPVPTQSWYPAAALLLVTAGMAVGEARLHLYRRVWSVASLNDAFAIGLAIVEATLIVTIINFLFPDGSRPLRVGAPALAAPAVVIGIGLLRLLPRLTTSSSRPTGNRLLVVIPDEGAYPTVKALIQQPNPDWTPVAVVTTGPADVGRTLLGVPVIGSTSNLRRWIRDSAVQGVAVVEGAASDRAQARKLFAECLAAQLPVFIVPAAESWFPRPSGSRLRQLSADDLVGRDEREIDVEMSANEVRNRVVMVTGAAGSIGSELCRLLAGMGPKRLV